MTRYFCILILLIIPNSFFGQNESLQQKDKKNSIQFDFGFIHSRMIDQGYTNSNLLFRGTNSKFGLSYGRETGMYVFNVSLTASLGKVKSKSDNLPSDFYIVSPSAAYARKIKEFGLLGKMNVFFAGIHLSSINYGLQNDPVFDNIDIFSLHGFYFSFYNRLEIAKGQSLELNYFMPTMVFVNRILWNGGASNFSYSDRDHLLKTLFEHGRFSYFNVTGNIQFGADYILRLGRLTDFEVKYRFFYLNIFRQAPVHMYSNELLLGLKFKL